MFRGQICQQDEEARRRIVNDLDTTILVEAGAGSGKTASLVQRMAATIAFGAASVSQMAAITFTNKAAEELRGRFRMTLEAKQRMSATEEERNRLGQAMSQLAECFIGTIHSFCGRLLKERPLEAGIDPQFREIDEMELQERLHRYWDEYITDERQLERLKELEPLGVHVEDLRSVFVRVAKYEDVQVATTPVERPDFDRIRGTLLPLIEEVSVHLPASRPEGGWDSLQQAVRNAIQGLQFWNLDQEQHVLQLASLFNRSLQVTQKRWPDGKNAKAFREQFSEWRSTVMEPFLDAWRQYLHPQLIDFVQPVVVYSQKRRAEEGVLSFQDLLIRAAALLREHPHVRRYFSNRYTRLFVDEFQDTDPVQAELMLLLTSDAADERSWQMLAPKPGALFIVGDPKQSIYRFRRADIATYNLVKRNIATHGIVLQLTQNFRTTSSVSGFINYAFEAKFLPPGSSGDNDYQAPFAFMSPTRSIPRNKRLLHGVYTITCPKAPYDKKGDIAAFDADRIVRWIAWASSGNVHIAETFSDARQTVARPAKPGDFMILLKHRDLIGIYAEALEKYGVAADSTGGQILFDEIRALKLLTATLHNPEDTISLLGVLRGMLFGLSDQQLYAFKREAGLISLHSWQSTGSLSEQARPVWEALARLCMYRQWVLQEPALTAFLRIVEDMGMIPFVAELPSGTHRTGAIVKLLEAIGSDLDSVFGWDSLTGQLAKIVDKTGLEVELHTETESAVRMMNVHKAKGLEAPIVFLAGPCGDHHPDVSEHIDRLNDPPVGYFTISRKKDAYHDEVLAQPAGWREIAEKETLYTKAEQDRLLYVAASRAKQLLIISQYPAKPAIDPWSGLSSSLGMQLELNEVELNEEELNDRDKHTETASIDMAWDMIAVDTDAAERTSVKLDEITLPRSTRGKGAGFGIVIHRCLKALGNGLAADRLETFLQMAAEEEGVSAKWLPKAKMLLERIQSHDIWLRALSARQKFHEFSIVNVEQKEGKEEISSGTIDLVFEEADGWVIVDFKTDSFHLRQFKLFTEAYTPQIARYARSWERLQVGRVKECGLYFFNYNRYIPIHLQPSE